MNVISSSIKFKLFVVPVRFRTYRKPLEVPKSYISENFPSGRVICQLMRLTLKYCKEYPASHGMRQYIDKHMKDFALANPNVVVYVLPKRHRRPKLVGEYLNGGYQVIDVNCFSCEDIKMWVEFLRTRQGHDIVTLIKPMHTDYPSIQGVWNPYTFKNPRYAVNKYPLDECECTELSATDKIMELHRSTQSEKDVYAQ